MKRYIKDGKIKTRNQIVIKGQRTIKDNNGNDKVVTTITYNPTEEMIFADGWAEYITPVYEPTIEDYRRDKIREIEDYDASSHVNEFYVQGAPIWLDKATRAGLKLRFEAEMQSGKTDTAIWYNGTQYPLSVETAVQMLLDIELYASACYDNTQRHIATVKSMKTIDDINSYDYKIGYPEKLRF